MDSSGQVASPTSVIRVFCAAALVPSPPLLVPELMGRAAAEATELRAAAVSAVEQLSSVADRWLAVGVDDGEGRYDETTVGTMRGYGVDVEVRLSGSPARSGPDPELPLAVLLAGWLRGAAAADGAIEVRTVPADASARWCSHTGMELRRELDASDDRWGVLVLADGANTLTPKAPGSFDSRAADVQRRIDDALATADVDALAELDEGLCAAIGVRGRPAWQLLAALAGTDVVSTTELYRGAPFGVGYFVGVWSRG